MSTQTKVVIIGAGASGMATALALSQHPERYQITVLERAAQCGGMATSFSLPSRPDGKKYSADASYINDGVQGCSPQFYNTLKIFEMMKVKATEVGLQVSFGREPGREGDFWTNVFKGDVIDQYKDDIKKFGKVLKIVGSLEPLFGLIPVHVMLRMFRFSAGFGDVIVYPLVALFMGTGQQTPYVSSVILERLFMDPSMKLFEYSPETFLSPDLPTMLAFPRLSTFYSRYSDLLEGRGVDVRTHVEVVEVARDAGAKKGGVKVKFRRVEQVNNDLASEGWGKEFEETYDEVVFACDADSALKILGKNASFLEKRVLGNVKYLWDVSVTHTARRYMEKYYRLQYDPSLASSSTSKDDERLLERAEKSFQPIYFIRSYPSDKKKIEMSFDLTNYQPQFKGVPEDGMASDGSDERPSEDLDEHVFQTIFLDKTDSSHLWSKDEIPCEDVLLEKWWKQQSHRWQHYAGTVPWMMWINGKRHTHFAGAWTMLNMHEIAIVSGFAAAYQLGADYPFNKDEEARRMFLLCLAVSHGTRMRKADRSGFFS